MIGFAFRAGIIVVAIGAIGLVAIALLPVAATKDILDRTIGSS